MVMEESDFTKPWSKSDVTFEVEQKKLYFNRGVLAFHSDVFDRMFNGEFAERDSEKDIQLPEKKFEDVQAMLFVLKSPANHASPVTEGNLNPLLAMSDEYQMRQLAVECGKFILVKWRADGAKHLKAVEIAFRFGLQAVAETFLPLAACRRLSEIDAAYESLPLEVYMAILHGHLLRCQKDAIEEAFYYPSITNKSFHDSVSVDQVKCCSTCGYKKIQAPDQCQCTVDAPTDDPKIQAVLANFAKISQKMK